MYLLVIIGLVFIQTFDCYFNIYPTDRIINNESIQYNCLRYYVLDDIVAYEDFSARVHQIISYCIHSNDRNIRWNGGEIDGIPYQFADLARKNVTIHDLITWSASIDVVERYQIYQEKNHTESLSSEVFYNCTWPLFGTFCQYSFESFEDCLSDVVRNSFVYRHERYRIETHITNGTCYTQLQCNRGPPPPSCLDWREICDGKIDCLDGEDEDGCFELEISECTDQEYRCRNGQCIPQEFLWDDLFNPDCLDRTDTAYTNYPKDCSGDPSFRCEEHTCKRRLDFACGDGSCTDPEYPCSNGRKSIWIQATFSRAGNSHLSHRCWSGITYTTKISDFLQKYLQFSFPVRYSMAQAISDIKNYCPSLFLFPLHPLLFDHIRLVYSNNNTDDVDNIWKPVYICYHRKLCDFLTSTIEINGSHCISFDVLRLTNKYNYWGDVLKELQDIFRMCAVTMERVRDASTFFRCPNSSKIIAKHYLVDSYVDCANGTDELFNGSCSLQDKYRFACPLENRCISSISVRDGKQDCNYDGDCWY